MSRSKSHGHFTDSPSRLAELEPEATGKSFSSHGSSGPDNALPQDQVGSCTCVKRATTDACCRHSLEMASPAGQSQHSHIAMVLCRQQS